MSAAAEDTGWKSPKIQAGSLCYVGAARRFGGKRVLALQREVRGWELTMGRQQCSISILLV